MWKDLSMREKAALIKMAVDNEVYDLGDIKDTYNKFTTGGPLNDTPPPKVAAHNHNEVPIEKRDFGKQKKSTNKDYRGKRSGKNIKERIFQPQKKQKRKMPRKQEKQKKQDRHI